MIIMITRFSTWPLSHRLIVIGTLAVFWWIGASFSHKHGNRAYFHTDETAEQFTLFAANHYVDHGFFENYLLPTYPPFGQTKDGKNRSEPFVYTHFLAGQDLILGFWLKLVGKDHAWSGRLIPHTITVFVLFWLVLEFSSFMSSSLLACIFLGLLMLPRALTSWSTCLYGHSYAMAAYLALIAGILSIYNHKKISRPATQWILGIAVGFIQLAFEADWLPATFISCIGFLILVPGLKIEQCKRIVFGMIIGGILAASYQVVIGSLYFGSLKAELADIIDFVRWRAGALTPADGINPNDIRVHKLFQEFNRAAFGATSWPALNMVALSAAIMTLGFVSKVRSKAQTERMFLGLAVSAFAAWFWTLTMHQHAFVHMRLVQRHSIILYITMLFTGFLILTDVVKLARANR